MKNMINKMSAAMAVATTIFFAAPSASFAQAQEPLRVSIEQAEEIALQKNPMLSMAEFDAKAASARWRMEKSRRKPSLSTTSFLSNGDMNGILSGPDSVMPKSIASIMSMKYFDQSAMFMAPLDYSGKISRSIKAAGRKSAEASLRGDITKLDVKLEVRMAYYEALYHHEHAKVYEDSVKFAEEQLKIDETSLEAGKVPSYYVDRDRAELAMNQQMLAESKADARIAKIRLAELMGLDPATAIELTDSLDAPKADAAKEESAATSPDVALSELRAESALASLQAARRAYAPDVSLTLMSDRISSEDAGNMNGSTAALIVAFPLYDGGMRRAGAQEARAMRDAALAEKRKAQLKAKADCLATKLMFDLAIQNIETTGLALKSAEENFRVAKMRYDAGKGILVEMLDAQSSITQARLARLEAIRQALIAKDMLDRISGNAKM